MLEPTIDFRVAVRIGDASYAWVGSTTSEFLTEDECHVALNGAVFDVFAKNPGDPMHVEVLSLSRSDSYELTNKRDALLIGTNRRTWIAPAPLDTRVAYCGLSGDSGLLIEMWDGSLIILKRPCGPPPGLLRRVAKQLGVFARWRAGSRVAGR